LLYLRKVVGALSKKITVILGGHGPTYTPHRIHRSIKPDWMIRGEGEKAFLELVLQRFDPKAISKSYVTRNINGSYIVDSTPMPLDDVPFARPYSLAFYNYEASPLLQKGCAGKCVFCSGAYKKTIEYKSPKKALELLEYLVYEKKAAVIMPAGPDFTASAKEANEIVRAMVAASLPLREFRPEVCLHTLHFCVSRDPNAWRKLGSVTCLRFESSIDSFLHQRLERLGKNVPKEFLTDIFHHIIKIIEICDCTIMLSRIALDPFITIDEFIAENSLYMRLLEKFPNRVTIGGNLMNKFRPVWGTPSMAAGKRNNPWAQPDVLLDPIMAELKQTFLERPEFKKWCRMAEELTDYNERNLVFREILRVTGEYAESLMKQGRSTAIADQMH